MSDNKPRSVEIIADNFSGGIDASPEVIVMTKDKKRSNKITHKVRKRKS